MQLVQDTPAVFRPRRFSDLVSPLNEAVFDQARKTQMALQHLDAMGIEVREVIINARVQEPGTHVLVTHCAACEKLHGQVKSGGLMFDLMSASVYGCEVVWSQEKEAA